MVESKLEVVELFKPNFNVYTVNWYKLAIKRMKKKFCQIIQVGPKQCENKLWLNLSKQILYSSNGINKHQSNIINKHPKSVSSTCRMAKFFLKI